MCTAVASTLLRVPATAAGWHCSQALACYRVPRERDIPLMTSEVAKEFPPGMAMNVLKALATTWIVDWVGFRSADFWTVR
jgi:hypothetical protein